MTSNNQVLPSKEASLFRHLVQNYETKQYKKGLKAAEQILRKQPNHGDTQAMKALILSNQGKQEEAFELCKLALKNSMKSHVCWHVYGLLYRSVKNYEEAIKAYRFALKLEPESQQIQRDLALLQVQMRDFAGFVQSRNQMLLARPHIRQNWTGLAVALHLNGELEKAEDVLRKYEETIKQTPPKSDIEHAEAALYQNTIIAEQGDLKRALEHLETVYKGTLDKTAAMEMRANYLLQLDKKDEAEKAYRALLDRNLERRAYYEGLEKAMNLNRENVDDHTQLVNVYQEYANRSPRIDAARRIPLDFLSGEQFRAHAESYLRRMFTKGVPSTFANVKQLYVDPEKLEIIQQLVQGFALEEPQTNGGADKGDANGSTDGSHKTNGTTNAQNWPLSVNYFLAQHYNYSLCRDLQKAEHYIQKAISLNTSASDYTYQMTHARIMKHQGDHETASKAMNEARNMDLKDRYINTKCAKYQLRNDENQAAVDTMGLFTRKEAVGGPFGDLLDMQCVWFITEDGESYLRQGKISLALKRFKAVYDIFEVWTEDQFDFHTFSLRKGMIRAYIDMVRWEDKLREHPFYTRAALSAIQIYILLHDHPEASKGGQMNGGPGESAADKRKAAKKARKEAEKAETERKAAAAKKAQPKADEEGNAKKEDPDPQGLELLKTETPLEEATKYLIPMLELSPNNVDGQIAGFEVYIRRRKYLPALRCLLAIKRIDSEHPKNHELSGRLRIALGKLSEPLSKEVQEIVQKLFLSKLDTKSLQDVNEDYAKSHSDSAAHIYSVVRLRQELKPGAEDTKSKGFEDLRKTIDLPSTTLLDVQEGAKILDTLQVDDASRSAYLDAARSRWPQATSFKLGTSN